MPVVRVNNFVSIVIALFIAAKILVNVASTTRGLLEVVLVKLMYHINIGHWTMSVIFGILMS